MLEEQTTLITFLKEVIREYENKIELLKKNNDSILILNRGLIVFLVHQYILIYLLLGI